MSAILPLALLWAGAAFCYYDKPASPGADKTVTKAPKKSKPPIVSTDQLDTYILMIKGVKKFLKYNKKVLQQVRYIVQSGVLSINFGDWIRSPKFVETMVLLLGTVVMARSNFKPFKGQPGLSSRVTAIGGALLTESKSILTMYQLMIGISDLAKKRKPPIRELAIAGSMILAGKVSAWYFSKS